MKRILKWRRLRWFAIGAAVRFVLRRSASRSVDRATADIEDRLPEPVRKALDLVPADAARVGGSAIVAAKTAKRVATGGRRASQLANDRRRQVTDGIQRVRSIGDEITREADIKTRELKAQYLRATDGNAAADDALLDVRMHRRDDEDLPLPKTAVRSGRWRANTGRAEPPVNRVRRSYRPQTRPWDR
ncbi:MAG: hypothetical protein ACRBK7_09595 [Acidimicrobiales bacterium]